MGLLIVHGNDRLVCHKNEVISLGAPHSRPFRVGGGDKVPLGSGVLSHMSERWGSRAANLASDWGRGLSQNYDKDQNQDREDQHTCTQEYDFAHYVGLQ